jgi:hypothetical protein
MIKDVYKSQNGKEWVEQKICHHPRQLALTSRYIAPYWFQALHNVFKYEKQRGLQEIHKLADDSRIKRGFELYKNGHITHWVVTKHRGGDVHANVLSENKKDSYTVIIKDYLPEKLPQYNYQREDFIASLFCDCGCNDHIISHYKDNSSMLCKHVCAVLWFLMNDSRFNMPRIFITPEVKMVGYQKSETDELETEIQSLPLINFSQYINILLLKKFRDMKPALGISIHKVDNKTHLEETKPIWLTYTELKEVANLIKGITKAYREMAKAEGQSDEQIIKDIDTIVDRPVVKKRWFWQKK